MYLQKITLQNNSDFPNELLLDEFYWLMSMYRKSGQVQVQGGLNTQCINGGTMLAYVYTLEKTSLNRKNNSPSVSQQIRKLEKLSGSKITRSVEGSEFMNQNTCCACNEHQSLTLTALLFSRESALLCNTCNLSVPLYKLPPFEGGDYEPIVRWHLSSLYLNGIETLNLDRQDFPEIPNNLINGLDKQADEIIAHIHNTTGIPVRKLSSVTSDSDSEKYEAGAFEMTE